MALEFEGQLFDWRAIRRYPIADRGIVEPRRPLTLFGIEFEAFPVREAHARKFMRAR